MGHNQRDLRNCETLAVLQHCNPSPKERRRRRKLVAAIIVDLEVKFHKNDKRI